MKGLVNIDVRGLPLSVTGVWWILTPTTENRESSCLPGMEWACAWGLESKPSPWVPSIIVFSGDDPYWTADPRGTCERVLADWAIGEKNYRLRWSAELVNLWQRQDQFYSQYGATLAEGRVSDWIWWSTHAHTHTHTHGHTSLSSFTHKPVQVTLFYNFTLLSAQIHAHIIGTVIFRLLGEKHWVSPSCTNVFSLCSHCCLYSHDGGWSETEHISAWRWRSTLFALALQEAWKLLYYWILPSQVLREVEAFSVLFTTLEL